MTVLPLVVSLLITGVASAKDVQSIGRLGGRTIVVFLLLLIGTAALVMPLAPSLFSLLPSGAKPPIPSAQQRRRVSWAAAGTQTLGSWLTSLIPTNPIAAAANSQLVPLVLFTLLFALATVRSAPRRAHRSSGSPSGWRRDACDRALGGARSADRHFRARIAARDARRQFARRRIGFYIAAYSIACIVCSAAALSGRPRCLGACRCGHSRAPALPSQLIAFSSSSSIASLPALVESAERGLNMNKSVSGFVLPLSVSTFKIAAPVRGRSVRCSSDGSTACRCTRRSLAHSRVRRGVSVVRGPGVPRGAFILLSPLFVAIHLPPEGIGILIAV